MGGPTLLSSVYNTVSALSSTAHGFTHAEVDSGWLQEEAYADAMRVDDEEAGVDVSAVKRRHTLPLSGLLGLPFLYYAKGLLARARPRLCPK